MIRWLSVALLVAASLPSLAEDRSQVAPILRAAEVALRDYEHRISQEPKDWEYGEYVSDIRNYNVGMTETRDSYVIVIDLKDIPGHERFFGGRADYYVDKGSLKIVRFIGHK